VRRVRPTRQPAFLKLAFAPGECAQVDWGSFGSVPVGQTTRRLSFFVMVLCYCRLMYVEFTVSQTMEHFLACHQHAFEAFGGVPSKVMVDNLKSAVLRRSLGQAPVFNPKYAAFSQHYGFDIVPCNVGKGNEKGRVENAVGYVKKNFLAGLDIADFAMLAPAAKHWLDTVANVRVHGQTRKRPGELWQSEKPYLTPLPAHPFDIATVSQVRASKQFRITLETNRYSVPAQGQSSDMTSPDRPSPSKPIPIGSASTASTISWPNTQEVTTAMVTSNTPITPSPCSNNAKRRVTINSSCVFWPSRLRLKPLTGSSNSAEVGPATQPQPPPSCAKDRRLE
jgi:Integrase core domain